MTWGSRQELYIYIFVRDLCKVEQPDALQHNGMTNSRMEMCKWS